jgi:RNA polymerase sigma-70 factor, ECF subfamily
MYTDGQTRQGGLNQDDLLRRAIADAKAGDTSALHFLYVRYADDVQRVALNLVGDVHEAEDLTQSVFARLITAIRRYEQREAVPFGAWLMRVARNATLDHLRRQRAIPSEEIFARDDGHQSRGHESAEILREALDQLPPEQREVLVLRHIAGLSPAEIASRLGKSQSSIHGLHHRGRKALQVTLRDMQAAPVTTAG